METKSRHGCVTAWLIMIIIVNSFTALLYMLSGSTLSEYMQGQVSDMMFLLLGVMSMLNVLFAILLMKWKKWGFIGFAISSILVLLININIGISVAQSLLGLIGVAILYGILQIKRDGITTWENLE